MAYGYVTVDRDQQFLLPPDVRDWLPAGHLVWLVLDVVARVDTGLLHACHRNDGAGRAAYDPDMLLGLLVYAYCTGQRSSRRIEQLCEVDVAYRVLAANRVPDHSTIARFRQAHELIAASMFTDVLVLCAAAGLASVGVVAVDGTKIGAAAAKRANRTRAQIEVEVAKMFADAEVVDGAEDGLFGDARGDELPAELADRGSRAARLDAALAVLNAQDKARRVADDAARRAREDLIAGAAARGAHPNGRIPVGPDGVAEAKARLAGALAADEARRAGWEATGGRGRRPGEATKTKRARRSLVKAEAQAAAAAERQAEADRVNVTDPDSRMMKTADGYIQAYNAQASVNIKQVVVAADVSQDHNDLAQCVPMIDSTLTNLASAAIAEPVGLMLFDAGYCSTGNILAPGPDRLIATTTSYKLRRDTAGHDDPTPDDTPIKAMEHRLRTDAGAALYGLRQHTVEPVFGNIKDGRGFRRFTRRGLRAANAEWQLITATHNILKLFRAGAVIPATT